MKAWRKVARSINEQTGEKHSGRKYLAFTRMQMLPKQPHPIVMGLMQRAGIEVKVPSDTGTITTLAGIPDSAEVVEDKTSE